MRLQTMKHRHLYQGPQDSHAFNTRMNDIHTDLAMLYDEANTNASRLTMNTDVLLREYQFVRFEVERLRREMAQQALAETYRLAGERRGISRVLGFEVERMLVNDELRAPNIDADHGVVTPGIVHRASKVSFQTGDGQVMVSSQMGLEVIESTNVEPVDPVTGERRYTAVEHPHLDWMVDKKKETYFHRTARFETGSGVRIVHGEVHLRLPVETLTNLYANAISLRPFPEGSMTIEDVHVKSQGSLWERLPAMERDGSAVPVANARHMLLVFPRRELTEVRIRFSQPYWVEADGMREFSYGFQDIDVQYREFTENESEFVTVHEAPSGRRFHVVDAPEVLYASGTDGHGQVEHELYFDPGLVSRFEFGSEILVPLTKVYVKTRLRAREGAAPVIERLDVPYRFKERDEL